MVMTFMYVLYVCGRVNRHRRRKCSDTWSECRYILVRFTVTTDHDSLLPPLLLALSQLENLTADANVRYSKNYMNFAYTKHV